ncbi:MAG: flagellin FliC [Marinospirillum sp.]|uniref:flagellin N-terminal helical domain-containing protein n=1 Tax=Marinospirillum sp. TaxID=2183934 RepID=UPI0019EDE685|nr:flagellin [Marinospirillum sp.]MBE0508502.1 flagellin FliC [Marinospirillum sp.]
MSLVLNTNIAALNASRNLATTQNQQATTFQRLSTGLRINSAKDDAAGLYLAQSQTKDIRGLNMATRNAGDGISMAQTAEGALDQITANLQRINELAIQSANGTYNTAARGGLQKEVDQLTMEIARIIETTEFNGMPLLNSGATDLVLQIGFTNESASRINAGIMSGGLAETTGAGSTGLQQIISAGFGTGGAINITTQSAAQSAISLTRASIDKISEMRATFGAVMNRFEAVISGNNIYAENLTAARSRIQDADFATETSNLAKQQVLQQAGVASLSQANQASQVILGLL